jgi:hypothetical protein
MAYPPIPPGGFGGNCLFSRRWREGSTVRYIVFKNLEAKFLKTENLRGAVRETGPDAMPRPGLRTIHNSQLHVSEFKRNNRQTGWWRKSLKII